MFLPAGDRPGIERLVQYMTRCPFSLSRLVKVTKTGQVIKVDLRGHRHVRGHILIFTDASRPGDGSRMPWETPIFKP